jgi:hypothetical protein
VSAPHPSDFLPEGTPRGLPGPLPPGERILWQGAPTTHGIWLRVFHAPLVALWFCACGLVLAATVETPARLVLPLLAALAAALVLLRLIAAACHRTTLYTVTDRRLVLQIGMALPVTYNLPFAAVEGAGLHRFRDGSGDLAVQLKAGARIAYLQLWPHGRPWRVSQPEPMLRSVPDAAQAAAILARALTLHRDRATSAAPVIVARPRSDAAPGRLVAAE